MKLVRPSVPAKIELEVALRQLRLSDYLVKLTVDHAVAHRQAGIHRDFFLELLADKLGCAVGELDLDHDPPLGARKKVYRRGVHVDYDPPANDPTHLIYRVRVAHRVKTNVRGEHGQHPDRVLIKKNRRLERKQNQRVKPGRSNGGGQRFTSSTDKLRPQRKWPSRPFPKGRGFSR